MRLSRASVFLMLIQVLIVLSFLPQASADPDIIFVDQTHTPNTRRWEDIKSLKIMSYNVENFFLRKVGDSYPKPLPKIEKLRDVIIENNPDILILEEMDDLRALHYFNVQFLQNGYLPLLIEGNDPRGIDVGALVKRDLPFFIEYRSHRREIWTDPVTGNTGPLFSRDIPEMRIYRARPKHNNERPNFVIIGTHFKSKRERPNDPESRIMRKAQVDRTAYWIRKLLADFSGQQTPIILTGDFNGNIHREPEFYALWDYAFLSDTLADNLPAIDRVTHTYHPYRAPAQYEQIDAVLISRPKRPCVDTAAVYRYKDSLGRPLPLPRTYEERSRNPSDHYPIWTSLNFSCLVSF